MADAQNKEFVVEIPMEEDEPLGATPNDKLVVIKVQAGTLADGKIKVGDQIVKINDTPILNSNHFFKLLRFAPPCARLSIIRDEKKVAELESRMHIPADRAKLIQRRDGFAYSLVKIEWKAGGPKLGLGIKHYQNRVLVSRADPGTLAASVFVVGDHIIDIDGTPVTDKDVARDLLLKALQARGHATSVIERPETMETKHWTNQALTTQVAQPPSVQMNSDVRNILAKERKRQMEQKPQSKGGILTKEMNKSKHVTINDKATIDMIYSDNEGKNLRSVRK